MESARETDYRAYVGPLENYDRFSALQFNLLTTLGLREDHTLLDIGCGSLRAGRLFMPYLKPERYFGLEPVPSLIDEGYENEIGRDIARVKRPKFKSNDQFDLEEFGAQFDYLLAQSIFSHTTLQQLRQCLASAARVMKPTSYFVATYFKADKDYAGDEWTVKATFREDTMSGLIKEQGLKCSELNWPHPDMQTWLLITHEGTEHPALSMSQQEELLAAQEQLRYCQEKLARIEGSRYVKFGFYIRDHLRKYMYGFKRNRINANH